MSQRKFIFLEAIDGYSISTKNVKGHTQFDQIKNKLVVKIFVEGLGNEEYGIDLLLTENTCVNIGTINGQNKTNRNFYANYEVKEISAILVYPIKEQRDVVLIGYLKDKDKINLKEINFLRSSQLQTKKHSDVEFQNNQYNIKKEYNIEKENNVEKDECTNNSNFFNEEISETNNMQSETRSDKTSINKIEPENNSSEKVDNNNQEQINKKEKLKGGVYNNQIFYLWENIQKLDENLKPANPFMQPIPKHKWWKVKEYDSEIQYYCILYNGYLMPMIYPFMNFKNISMMDKDWIFGAVTEEYGDKEVLKYFVYGIPGRFYMQEQPLKGSTGYLYWQSEDVVKSEPNGYWLLYVDVHTGKIVIPRRPVKPPLNKDIMHNDL